MSNEVARFQAQQMGAIPDRESVPQKTSVVSGKSGSLLPDQHTLDTVERLAEYVVSSGEFQKKFRNKSQAVITMLKGDNLGITFSDALEHVYVVNGKSAISGQLMLRLIYERVPGATLDFIHSDGEKCVVSMGRPNKTPREFSFTIQEAEAAGLLYKKSREGNREKNFVWHAYREDMLRWRAVSRGARVIFPDAIQGCYLDDELKSGPMNDPQAIVAQVVQDEPDVYEPEAVIETPSLGDGVPDRIRNMDDGALHDAAKTLLYEYNHAADVKLSYRGACEELLGLVISEDAKLTRPDWEALVSTLTERLEEIRKQGDDDDY